MKKPKIPQSKIPKTWSELVALKDYLCVCGCNNLRFRDHEIFYVNYQKSFSKELRHKIIFKTIGKNDVKIIRNAFPYNRLTKNLGNVGHYCLWSKKGQLSDVEIESLIKDKFKNKDYFWFENSIETKSIPEIWHCHIFVKEN